MSAPDPAPTMGDSFLEETAAFFLFAYQRSSPYKGTFKFIVHPDKGTEGTKRIMTFRVDPNSETAVTPWFGNPPDGKVTCTIELSRSAFKKVYSGTASTSEVARMCLTGEIYVHWMNFGEVRNFAGSFDMSTNMWLRFYLSRKEDRDAYDLAESHFAKLLEAGKKDEARTFRHAFETLARDAQRPAPPAFAGQDAIAEAVSAATETSSDTEEAEKEAVAAEAEGTDEKAEAAAGTAPVSSTTTVATTQVPTFRDDTLPVLISASTFAAAVVDASRAHQALASFAVRVTSARARLQRELEDGWGGNAPIADLAEPTTALTRPSTSSSSFVSSGPQLPPPSLLAHAFLAPQYAGFSACVPVAHTLFDPALTVASSSSSSSSTASTSSPEPSARPSATSFFAPTTSFLLAPDPSPLRSVADAFDASATLRHASTRTPPWSPIHPWAPVFDQYPLLRDALDTLRVADALFALQLQGDAQPARTRLRAARQAHLLALRAAADQTSPADSATASPASARSELEVSESEATERVTVEPSLSSGSAASSPSSASLPNDLAEPPASTSSIPSTNTNTNTNIDTNSDTDSNTNTRRTLFPRPDPSVLILRHATAEAESALPDAPVSLLPRSFRASRPSPTSALTASNPTSSLSPSSDVSAFPASTASSPLDHVPDPGAEVASVPPSASEAPSSSSSSSSSSAAATARAAGPPPSEADDAPSGAVPTSVAVAIAAETGTPWDQALGVAEDVIPLLCAGDPRTRTNAALVAKLERGLAPSASSTRALRHRAAQHRARIAHHNRRAIALAHAVNDFVTWSATATTTPSITASTAAIAPLESNPTPKGVSAPESGSSATHAATLSERKAEPASEWWRPPPVSAPLSSFLAAEWGVVEPASWAKAPTTKKAASGRGRSASPTTATALPSAISTASFAAPASSSTAAPLTTRVAVAHVVQSDLRRLGALVPVPALLLAHALQRQSATRGAPSGAASATLPIESVAAAVSQPGTSVTRAGFDSDATRVAWAARVTGLAAQPLRRVVRVFDTPPRLANFSALAALADPSDDAAVEESPGPSSAASSGRQATMAAGSGDEALRGSASISTPTLSSSSSSSSSSPRDADALMASESSPQPAAASSSLDSHALTSPTSTFAAAGFDGGGISGDEEEAPAPRRGPLRSILESEVARESLAWLRGVRRELTAVPPATSVTATPSSTWGANSDIGDGGDRVDDDGDDELGADPLGDDDADRSDREATSSSSSSASSSTLTSPSNPFTPPGLGPAIGLPLFHRRMRARPRSPDEPEDDGPDSPGPTGSSSSSSSSSSSVSPSSPSSGGAGSTETARAEEGLAWRPGGGDRRPPAVYHRDLGVTRWTAAETAGLRASDRGRGGAGGAGHASSPWSLSSPASGRLALTAATGDGFVDGWYLPRARGVLVNSPLADPLSEELWSEARQRVVGRWRRVRAETRTRWTRRGPVSAPDDSN